MVSKNELRPITYARGSGFQLTDGHKIHLLYGSDKVLDLIGPGLVWTECNQTFPFNAPGANPFAVIWSTDRVLRMLSYSHLRESFCKRCLKAVHIDSNGA